MTADHHHDHGHHGGHAHSHVPHHVSQQRLKAALILTVVFVAIEAVFGWLGPSLALLSDAGHNLQEDVPDLVLAEIQGLLTS